MDSFSRMRVTFPGAMEIGEEPIPPVPPDLDLDLDLDVDFDRLPEITIPEEEPAALPPALPAALPPAPKEASRETSAPVPQGLPSQRDRSSQRDPSSRAPWWPAFTGVASLLSIALLAVPFALMRLNDLSRDMARLSERIERQDAEDQGLHQRVSQEAMDAVAQQLADTDRRIDRVRGALDEVRRDREGRVPPPTLPKPSAPTPSAPVAEAPKAPAAPAPAPAEARPPAPALGVPSVGESKRDLPPPPGPIVGGTKCEGRPAIRPASAVKEQKSAHKGAQEEGHLVLPTELYNEDD